MKFIVCIESFNGIGLNGKLLIDIPQDKQFFKKKTMGNSIVMGRCTYESLPNKAPLPGRDNIILTRQPNFSAPGFSVYNDYNDIKSLDSGNKDVFIIGGQDIYSLCIDDCDEGYITRVDTFFISDRFFVDIDKYDNWIRSEIIMLGNFSGINFTVEKYVNNNFKNVDR